MKSLAVLLVLCAATLAHAQHRVTINWTQSTTVGVTGDNVYKSSTTGGPYTKIFTSSTPIITYSDSNVVGGGIYYYVVTATCTSCNPSESGYSNEAKATVPADAQPAAPTGVTVTTQ